MQASTDSALLVAVVVAAAVIVLASVATVDGPLSSSSSSIGATQTIQRESPKKSMCKNENENGNEISGDEVWPLSQIAC